MIDDALLCLSIILYFVDIRSSSRFGKFIRILFSLMILICILYFLSHSIMLCIFVYLIYDFYGVSSILLSHQLCYKCFIQIHPIFVGNFTILIVALQFCIHLHLLYRNLYHWLIAPIILLIFCHQVHICHSLSTIPPSSSHPTKQHRILQSSFPDYQNFYGSFSAFPFLPL